jgi:ribonuclease HII
MAVGKRTWDKIAGVDEAGRGPMIGPMVVCGILVDASRLSAFKLLGVKDSKMLSPRRRSELAVSIRDLADKIILRTISARSIDTLRRHGSTMNEIEVRAFASVVRGLDPDIAYLDAADVNAERFGDHVGTRSGSICKIVSEHQADSKYAVVSAASIIAKVERDTAIERLHRKHGDFGSGYPSDSVTVDFVQKLIREGGELPDFIRATWKSVSVLLGRSTEK